MPVEPPHVCNLPDPHGYPYGTQIACDGIVGYVNGALWDPRTCEASWWRGENWRGSPRWFRSPERGGMTVV